MEQIRAFIAVELPEELKLALTRLRETLRAGSRAPARWVDPYGIHLTLKFLGNVSPGMVGSITKALEEAARGIAPFQLEARGLGAFPNLNRVQVVWVGVSGEMERLIQLQQRVESSLRPLGFTPERRAFKPHLTLARLREQASPAERQSLGQLLAATGFDRAYQISVDAVHLMRSQLTREGAVYSRLGSVRL